MQSYTEGFEADFKVTKNNKIRQSYSKSKDFTTLFVPFTNH